MIESFQGCEPRIGEDVYIAPSASIIGDVELKKGSSVWHGASVRGDCWKITVGEYSNIQDGCVCHCTTGGPSLVIGRNVTVGHGAVLHSCRVDDGCLIGMGATVLDGAVIGKGSIVAAGAVVLESSEVPPASLVAGIPASVRRELDAETAARLVDQSMEYHSLAMSYLGRGVFKLPEKT